MTDRPTLPVGLGCDPTVQYVARLHWRQPGSVDSWRAQLLEAEGGPLTGDLVDRILGISRQAVEKRRRGGKLLGLDTGKRGYQYPSWQFDQIGLLRGVQNALESLEVHDPWMQATFFLNGSRYLQGDTPLAELRRGHVESVLRAARAYGEQGVA